MAINLPPNKNGRLVKRDVNNSMLIAVKPGIRKKIGGEL